jgi:hypothetical protein
MLPPLIFFMMMLTVILVLALAVTTDKGTNDVNRMQLPCLNVGRNVGRGRSPQSSSAAV